MDNVPELTLNRRYVMFTLGGIAILIPLVRPLVFTMPESPRSLLARNRDADVVESVNFVARANGKPEPLTLAMLQKIDMEFGLVSPSRATQPTRVSWWEALLGSLKDFRSANLKALFSTKKLAQHTSVLFGIWLTIGISFPLYFNFLPTYLSKLFTGDNSLNTIYRDYCIQSAVGVVGPLVAAWMIQTRLGRRYVMALGAVVTGAFLFAYTAARTPGANLAFSSISGLVANIGNSCPSLANGNIFTNLPQVYAILFAFTPESFPAPNRGVGSGVAAALLRVGGLIASLIGTYTDFSVVPIYVAASMWCGVGLLCFWLPFETHDHAAV